MSDLNDDELVSLCFCGDGFKLASAAEKIAVNLGTECFLSENLFAAGCTFSNEIMFNLGKKSAGKAHEGGVDIAGAINAGIIREPMKNGVENMLSEDAHTVFSLVKSYAEGAGGNAAVSGMLGGEDGFCERNIDSRAFYELYMRPFLRLAASFSAAVVPPGLLGGVPVCENKEFITLLKGSLKPDAAVINSFLSVSNVAATVKSGGGLITPGTDSGRAELLDALKSGEVTGEQIGEFVSNTIAFIQKLKNAAPIQKPPFRHFDEVKALCEKSIVLLENNGVLPVLKASDCFIVNETLIPRFKDIFGAGGIEAGKTTALVFAAAPDGKVDKSALDSLKEMRAKGLETVLILVCEHPCELGEELKADAVVFVPGVFDGTGVALSDILKGASEPSGRLPVTWAKSGHDYPALMNPRVRDKGMFTYESVFNGYRYFAGFNVPPRYYFGHGLSYADFRISGAELLADDGFLNVDFTLENLSARDGETVVFVFDNYTAKQVFGLKKRLVGFTRVFLEKNESKRVHMRVDNDEFTAYSKKEKGYVFLGGKHEISLAFSAEKDACRGEIKLKKSEADFSFCDAKRFPSYYSAAGFSPNAVEIEALTGAKLYARPHGRNEHVLSANKPCGDKALKKAAKIIKKMGGNGLERGLEKIPSPLIEKLIR